jgi:uncharacterized protein
VTNPRIDAITLGAADLERSKTFYRDGLGCPVENDYGVFVSFALGGGSSLSLYQRDALAADAGVDPAGDGFRAVTFSFLVASPAEVDDAMSLAERAGATIVTPAQKAQWGNGYFGYFADPDGHLWKVASAG